MPSAKKSSASKRVQKSTPKKQVVVQETAPVPVPEPVPEPAPVVETVETTPAPTETLSVEDQFKDILTRLQEFRSLSNTLMQDVRKLHKNVNRQIRESTKKNRRRKPASGDTKRPPSGFAKPALISDPLCQFLSVPSGTEMARTEVTKYLTKYIKEHKLQDSENKRIINCDTKLASLLSVEPSDEVTYFNLQKFMKPHFPTSAANLALAAAAAAASAGASS